MKNCQLQLRITNDDREVEMEQNMQGVGSILGTLKNMATDMGDEIERQNKHLDLIQGKVRRGHFLYIQKSFLQKKISCYEFSHFLMSFFKNDAIL